MSEIMTRELAEDTLEAWEDAGRSGRAAARELGIPRSTFRDRLQAAQRLLGLHPGAMVNVAVPEGHRTTRTTVQYDGEGNIEREWRKLAPQAQLLQEVADELCAKVEGKCPKLPKPDKDLPNDVMFHVGLWDQHIGMLAHASETGEDYDLKICEKLVIGAISKLVAEAGDFGKAVLVCGGDLFHSDTRKAITERGGNHLDVDSRQFKIWEVATRILHTCVELIASRCNSIKLIVIPGNHDWESSFHLSRLLEAYYRNEKRIEVVNTPATRQYVQHGTCLLGFHHGHLVKPKDLPSLMAVEQPKAWGDTTVRHWFMGHIHRNVVESMHGVVMEHMESLVSPDAWSAEMGYIGSQRRLTGFLWHAKYGLRKRIYVSAAEVLND